MLEVIAAFLFIAFLGQEAYGSAYSDSITLDGENVHVSETAAHHIEGEGLASILMDAAATAVFHDGEQIGYRLTDIQAGSVFQTVGLVERDVVLEVDGMPLTDPRRAVDILRYAKGLTAFDVKLIRAKRYLTLHVTIE